MIWKVFTIKPSNTVKELLHTLYSNRIGSVPVVDDQDHLVGMVSDGDVLRYLVPKPLGMAGLVYLIETINMELEDAIKEKLDKPVKEIMTRRRLISCRPDDHFETTLRLLSQHSLKKLPVINGAGRVIGVISRGDIICHISERLISE